MYYSSEFDFKTACQKGNLEAAQWIWRLTSAEVEENIDLDRYFSVACQAGQLNIVKWLVQIKKFDSDFVYLEFAAACGKGHLELVKWLWKTFEIIPDEWAYTSTCRGGHLPVAKWLWQVHPTDPCRYFRDCENVTFGFVHWLWGLSKEKVSLHDSADHLFKQACLDGDRKLVQWIYLKCPQMDHNVMRASFLNACEGGHLIIVQWLAARVYLGRRTINKGFILACAQGHLHIAQLWKCPIISTQTRQSAFREAFRGGHFRVVKWLGVKYIGKTKHDIVDTDYRNFKLIKWAWRNCRTISLDVIFNRACILGKLHIAKWARRASLKSDTFYFAAIFGNLNTVDFIWKKCYKMNAIKLMQHLAQLDGDILTKVCNRGHLDVAKYLWPIFKLSKKEIRRCFKVACLHGHLEMAEWLLSKLFYF